MFGEILHSSAAEITYVERFIMGGMNMHMLGTPVKHASDHASFYSSCEFSIPHTAEIVEQVRRMVVSSTAVLNKLVGAISTGQQRTKLALSKLVKMRREDGAKIFIDLHYSL
ncbi:hypothetical protein PAPHI01_1534 [Pancytospora philotis]|nr:hypothetical protein PAPHI01_1534 [Pancytospora philotis]